MDGTCVNGYQDGRILLDHMVLSDYQEVFAQKVYGNEEVRFLPELLTALMIQSTKESKGIKYL